jgi:hypothetical protein
VTFIAVLSLVFFIVQDDRRQRQLLANLERQGIRRRSAKQDDTAKPKQASPHARRRKS